MDLELMRPLKRIPLVNQVVDRLIEYIKQGDVHEGAKLPPEITLSESLSVGRGTIREAFRILHTRGYVTLIPGRGAFVASKEPSLHKWFQVNELEVRSVFEVRTAIEPLAVALAIENATPDDLKRLRHNLNQARTILDSQDHDQLASNDEEFHSLISILSGNSLISGIDRDIRDYLHEFRMRTFLIEQNRANYYPAHHAIVEAFDRRDSQLGVQAMKSHLEVAQRDLEKSKYD